LRAAIREDSADTFVSVDESISNCQRKSSSDTEDALVVLETLKGSIETVSGKLFDEDGGAWSVKAIALHEPQAPLEAFNRRIVGLEERARCKGC
jgi:hypothetical protein